MISPMISLIGFGTSGSSIVMFDESTVFKIASYNIFPLLAAENAVVAKKKLVLKLKLCIQRPNS